MTLEETRELRHRVERMDCGGCALKIENGLRRLPGAGDISVRLALASLSLAFDGDRITQGEIEGRIRALGCTPLPLDPEAGRATRAARAVLVGQPWWRTRKGQLVADTGALRAVAAGLRSGPCRVGLAAGAQRSGARGGGLGAGGRRRVGRPPRGQGSFGRCVMDGISDLDEAPVTGESVAEQAGEGVYASSINANGVLRVRITRTAAENAVARIARLACNWQSRDARNVGFGPSRRSGSG